MKGGDVCPGKPQREVKNKIILKTRRQEDHDEVNQQR
jgi:hypothetical protein